MLLNNIVFLVLSIGLPVVSGIAVAWLCWKRLRKLGVILGILLSAFAFAAFQVTSAHLYVVTGEKEWLDYRSFGSIAYELKDGTTIVMPYNPRTVQVINNTEEPVILEELVYGGASGFYGDEPVYGYLYAMDTASFSLPQTEIDFFFDQTIPDQIEVRGSQSTSRFWLHRQE